MLTAKQVVHNPGVLPDPRFQSGNQPADVTVLFEQTHSTFGDKSIRAALASVPYRREQSCYMMHSLPKDETLGRDELKGLVRELRRRAEHVFVTELDVDYYSRFGARWKEFINAMDD